MWCWLNLLICVKVSDSDPFKKKGEFEDVSQVEKYKMSEEDYSKRKGQLVMVF